MRGILEQITVSCWSMHMVSWYNKVGLYTTMVMAKFTARDSRSYGCPHGYNKIVLHNFMNDITGITRGSLLKCCFVSTRKQPIRHLKKCSLVRQNVVAEYKCNHGSYDI